MDRSSRRACIVFAAATLGACATRPPAGEIADIPATSVVGLDVLHQAIEIAPFSAGGVLTGTQELTFQTTTPGALLRFKGGPIRIVSIEVDGHAVPVWEMNDGVLDIPLARPIRRATRHGMKIVYEARPGRGFHLSDSLAYSTYFSCDWMLCDQENFDDRFTVDLSIHAPAGMATLGPGEQVGAPSSGPAGEVHHWRTREAFPAYTHAFAVGRLNRFAPSPGCTPRLEVLSTAPRERVEAIFAPTCAMLIYFEQRSGVPYPAQGYNQLYDPDRWEAQESISHSVLGGGAVEAMASDPREDWAVAHELAHQWWGNRVTARNLAEFWLNEGVVTFMVATWKEHRWGEEAYTHEIGLARARWNRCRAEWRDVPIGFAGIYPSVATRRCFQYSKAAVFLHELRLLTGDQAFWNGLRGFTTANIGRSVTSSDFEAAMQRETTADLGPLFAEWVYPSSADDQS